MSWKYPSEKPREPREGLHPVVKLIILLAVSTVILTVIAVILFGGPRFPSPEGFPVEPHFHP